MKYKYLLALSCLSVASHSVADSGFYSGVQWGSFNYTEEPVVAQAPKIDSEIITLGLQLGYQLNDYFSSEVRGGAQPADKREKVSILDKEVDVRFRLKYFYSAYLKAGIDYKFLTLYGLAGYSEVSLEASAPEAGVSLSSTGSGLSYGVGLGLVNSDDVTVSLEYLSLYDEDYITLDGVNLSFSFAW